MPSLADKTRISAQDTMPGHSLSRASLMVSRYLKFLSPKLLSISFSDIILLVESSSNDASHDLQHQHTYIYINTQHQHTYIHKYSTLLIRIHFKIYLKLLQIYLLLTVNWQLSVTYIRPSSPTRSGGLTTLNNKKV